MEHVVRAKWPGGYVEVSDGGTGRRRTIPFSAGNAQTAAAATAIAEAVLAQYGYTPRRSVQPTVVDTAGVWPQTGDGVTLRDDPNDPTSTGEQRIETRKVEIGRDRALTLTPTFTNEVDELLARQTLNIRRLTNGTVGGRSAGATPFTSVKAGILSGQMEKIEIPPWTWDPVDEVDGEIWEANRFIVLTLAQVTLTAPLVDDVSFFIYLNGVLQTFILVPAGEVEWAVLGSFLISPSNKMQCTIDSVGANTLADLDGVKATLQFEGGPGTLDRTN